MLLILTDRSIRLIAGYPKYKGKAFQIKINSIFYNNTAVCVYLKLTNNTKSL